MEEKMKKFRFSLLLAAFLVFTVVGGMALASDTVKLGAAYSMTGRIACL